MKTPDGVIELGDPIYLLSNPLAELPEPARKAASKYLRVANAGPNGFKVSRRDRYAGLLHTPSVDFWLPPPFSSASFIYLLLRSLHMDKLADHAHELASTRTDRRIPDFMQVLSLLMVKEAEAISAGHIAQSYASREERTHVVRGRALWHKSAGRPKDGTVLCRFQEKTTDNLPNRLILRGLEEASRWLAGSSATGRLRTQQFVWRSLATLTHPHRHDYDAALRSLNRLTAGYATGLHLSKALLYGFDPRGDTPDTPLGAPIFDLAPLFERLTELVLKIALSGTDISVHTQKADNRAILTADGVKYRSTRPDFVLLRSGTPALIVDAKYKPRYTRGGPVPKSKNRITREDLYQMFFYSQRTAATHSLPNPLPVAITAPAFGTGTPPNPDFRRLRWHSDTSPHEVVLNLLPIPVDDATDAVRQHDNLQCFTYVEDALDGIVNRPQRAPNTHRLAATVGSNP